jgi:hypothetical protein
MSQASIPIVLQIADLLYYYVSYDAHMFCCFVEKIPVEKAALRMLKAGKVIIPVYMEGKHGPGR